MPIIPLIIALFVIGFGVYMLYTFPIPIHPWFKNFIIGVVLICLLIWGLQMLGFKTGFHIKLD